MQLWIRSYTEMNIVGSHQLMKPGNVFFLYTFLVSVLGFLSSSGLKPRASINGFNAIRQKRDLLAAEGHGTTFSGAHRLPPHTAVSHSEFCPHGCLNGALCTEAGLCDCDTFQAQGDRCQFVPNPGKERDGICRSWGQYNFETFDGIYFYFPGNCSYIFARDCSNPVPLYTIWVHNSPVCDGSVYTCRRSISMFFSSQEEITVSGYEVRKGGIRVQLPQTVENVFIERLADYILVKTTFGFSLAWDGGSGIYIKLTEDHKGKPCGLCGNFNGNWTDDLTVQHTGETTEDIAMFANSWYVQIPDEPICVETASDYPNPCSVDTVNEAMFQKCQVLLQFPFLSCHETIDPYSYIASCMNDLCKQDDDETYCRAVMEYARACSHSGNPIRDWRDDFPACTEKCEENFVHRDCISCCPPTCTYEKECLGSNLHCLDGCYCPDGLILDNGACVSVTSCPCIYHGTAYPAGSKIEQECSMCICAGGVWNCTEHECPAECSVVGDSHFTTFDGRYFTFLGICQYILVKGIGKDKFTITLQKSSCDQHSDHACIQSITLVLDEDVNKQITILRNGDIQFGLNQAIILNGDIEVRNLSSMFVQLKTKFGIRIQFGKGGERLYIQASSAWKRRTLGLCGTFNGNLRDDFLSPAGMIEGTPQLHANAWKISSACLTPVNIPVVDPCDTNLQNVGYAAQCDVINQELFAPCHAYVSPALYYQLCRYDACKCGSNCLCNALAHYAYICNKHGVAINFRSHVSFCGVICRFGMLFHQCSSYCGRTCSSLSLGEVCTDECIEGCNCPDGKFFDESLSFCVPISSCRCYYKGRIYHPGEVILRQSGSCQCLNGTMRCTETATTMTGHTCPEGKIYYDCRNPVLGLPSAGVNCEVTCANLAMNFSCVPSPPCASGCICPPGMAEHKGKCYVPDSCPCTWKDWEYLSGEVITTPCYTCVCKRGVFNCTTYPCPSVCTVYGDRHYYTFDGLEYDYVSDCQAYLLKSTDNSNISIIAQNKKCFDNEIICSKNLVISVGGTDIYFTDTSEKQKQFRIQHRSSRYQHWKAGFYTVVHFPELDITILWDKKTTIHVKVGPRWKGKLSGLCGNFDKYTSNDLTTSNNMEVRNAQVFGDSWTIGQCKSYNETTRPCEVHQSKFPYAKKECSILYSDVFAPCRNVIDVTSFVKNCHTDTCNCNLGGDCECLCTSIAAYAHKCCQQGVAVHWRSPNMCPYDCEYYNQGLGEGPFILSSCGNSEIVLGVNITSKYIFPLPRMSAHGNVLFNFMVTPGLFRDKDLSLSLVSLESAERPNFFLTVQENDSVRLEQWETSSSFRRRATFFHHQGLWVPGYSAFELHSRKGFFIVLTATEVKVSKYDNSEEFKLTSGFKIEEIAAAVPYRRMCEWRYEPCASPCVKTCSDPEAVLCSFLPPVEGCIPYCPNQMILDEITLKCVYPEDCVPVKTTIPPTASKPIKTSWTPTVSTKEIKHPTMTEKVHPDFSDTSAYPTKASTVDLINKTHVIHTDSSIPSTSKEYESSTDLLTSEYDKLTHSTSPPRPEIQRLTTQNTSMGISKDALISSVTRTSSGLLLTSPHYATAFVTYKTLPPKEAVDTTKTPTRMLGQSSQGLYQLTTKSVTATSYTSMMERITMSLATDVSRYPFLLNVTSPSETSTSTATSAVSLTSPVGTTASTTSSSYASFTLSTTSSKVVSSQLSHATSQISPDKMLTSISPHTSHTLHYTPLLNRTASTLTTLETHIPKLSESPRTELTTSSIYLPLLTTQLPTTSMALSTSHLDLQQTTKAVFQTKLKEAMSTLSPISMSSKVPVVVTTGKPSLSSSTLGLLTSVQTSKIIPKITPLEKTSSTTTVLLSLETSLAPKSTYDTEDLIKSTTKHTSLLTTNATLIQTPPVTLSTKKFPKSTETPLKILTTSTPTTEGITHELESKYTESFLSTQHIFPTSSELRPTKHETMVDTSLTHSTKMHSTVAKESLLTSSHSSPTFDTSTHTSPVPLEMTDTSVSIGSTVLSSVPSKTTDTTTSTSSKAISSVPSETTDKTTSTSSKATSSVPSETKDTTTSTSSKATSSVPSEITDTTTSTSSKATSSVPSEITDTTTSSSSKATSSVPSEITDTTTSTSSKAISSVPSEITDTTTSTSSKATSSVPSEIIETTTSTSSKATYFVPSEIIETTTSTSSKATSSVPSDITETTTSTTSSVPSEITDTITSASSKVTSSSVPSDITETTTSTTSSVPSEITDTTTSTTSSVPSEITDTTTSTTSSVHSVITDTTTSTTSSVPSEITYTTTHISTMYATSVKHLETPFTFTMMTTTTEVTPASTVVSALNETTFEAVTQHETSKEPYLNTTHIPMTSKKEKFDTVKSASTITKEIDTTSARNRTVVEMSTQPKEILDSLNFTEPTTVTMHTNVTYESFYSMPSSTTESLISATATELLMNVTGSSDYYSFGTMLQTSSPSECMPRYIEPLDPCSQYVCINMGWMLYNVSSNCHKNVEKPDCGFRGMPVQVNTDSCCPEWECPCQCSVLSELSIITFDGNNIALYNAAPYILVRLPKETIVAHIEKCPPSLSVNSIRKLVAAGGTSGLCFKKLNVTTANFQVLINRLERRVEVNSVSQPLPFSKQGLCIQDTGAMYVINTPAGISIKWTHVTGIIDIQYGLHSNQTTKTEGLCGICNGDPSDDLKMQNRTIVTNKEDIEAFIKSWEIEKSIDVTTRRPVRNCTEDNCTYCMELLNKKVFAPCHRKVSPQDFCEKMWINNTYFLNYECDALSAYVALCSKHNICIRWRTKDYCSLTCPEGKEYQPCVQPCAAKTCLNKWYYEESPCSYLREDCVCKKGTILHRTDSELCIPEEKCACTDNEGNPRSPGEVWHSSVSKCCLSKCLENGTIVSLEHECSEVPVPTCDQEGETLISIIEEGSCCPKKVCECNISLCERPVTCKTGERLVADYIPGTCCPQFHCACDPSACPVVSRPECKADQIAVQVRDEDPCCFSYICVCESCTEPVPDCREGEIITVDLNTTSQCCPRYTCVCEENLCLKTQPTCMPETRLAKKKIDGTCCPDWYCECDCRNVTIVECSLGEYRKIDQNWHSACGCIHYICEKEEVCIFQGVTVLRPGQSLIHYLNGEMCYTVECLHEKNHTTGFYAMEILMVNCSTECAANQVYIPSSNNQMCCGSCKNVSCTFYNDNGTMTIYEVGNSWISNCTKYECTKTTVGAMILGSSVVCPPFNGSECLKNGGSVQTYNDGCCKICSGMGVLPFTISPVVPTAKINCEPGSKEEKICQKVAVRTTIRKSDCISQNPITVASCDGKCPSATIFNVNIDSHIRFCKCCRENGVQNLTVPLYCSGNGTEVMYVIQEPLDCSCQWN